MRYVCPECGAAGDGAGPCPTDGTQLAPVGSDALLGTTIGSWRVARVLGAGGMGRVYVAVQPQIGARVAIKVLKRESAADPDVVERFFNEARAVNVIKHENIVDVIDLGRLPDGAPYIVMEFLEGASLGTILRRDRQIALGTLARIVSEVLAALEAAHGKGVIHRDLKPDNVFVSPSGRVTVLDFGIAKLATAEGLGATQTGSLLGTPAYMSPEQARSQPVDARADLYAVGVMLYEASTGTLPFVAPNLFDLLQMHVAHAPPPPREKHPEIPEALEAVILRALAKDPAQRFGSAAEMRRALNSAVEGLPQLALSSLALGPEPTRSIKKPSDPFAATAATTQGSLARGETVPSQPPVAAKRAHVQLSRGTLIALLAGAALLGLGGAAVMMFAGGRDRDRARERIVVAEGDAAVQMPPLTPPLTPIDAAGTAPVTPEVTATKTTAITIDASVPHARPERSRPGAAPIDAGVTHVATGTADAGVTAVVTPRPRPKTAGLPDEPGTFTIANPSSFDVFAFYKKARAHAEKLGGKSVRLSAMRVRGMNRQGLVDITKTSAEIIFASPERKKADLYCYITFDFAKGEAVFSTGYGSETDQCTSGVPAPRCSTAQLWERAAAKGLPATAETATLNRINRYWQFTSGEFSEPIVDDCESPP